MRPKLVIFDLDGTLYNYDSAHNYALDLVLDEISGISGVEKLLVFKIYNESNLSLKKTLKSVASSHNRFLYFLAICKNLSLDLKMALSFSNLYWRVFFERIIVYEGCMDVLCRLKLLNIKTVLLTDFQSKETYEKLERLKLINEFDSIITSEEIGYEKPNEKCFLAACDSVKINKKFAIMVGDNYEKDILGAKSLGIFAVHITQTPDLNLYKSPSGYLQINTLKDFDIQNINI